MKKKRSVIPLIIWLLQLLTEGGLIFALYRLNMLPNAFFGIVAGVLAFMLGFTAWLLLMGGKREFDEDEDEGNGPGFFLYFRRFVGGLIALCMILVSGYGANVIMNAKNTVNDITTVEEISDVVAIYVRTDDPAQSLEDTKKYTFARSDAFDPSNSWKTISWIEEKLSRNIKTESFDSVPEMVDALLNEEVDAMILNESFYEILVSMEPYYDLDDRIRILDEYEIVEEVQVAETEAEPAETEETEAYAGSISERPFIVYLSGSDTRNKTLSRSNSDVNILMVVNPVSKQILLVNTPRDYYIGNPIGNGALDKLTHLGVYGTENSMRGLGDLYGCKVEYSCQINFTGFETLIDSIGGVNVNNDVAFHLGDLYYEKGPIWMNGEKALAYCRERHSFADGDNARGRHQMMVIKGIINQISNNTSVLLTNYSDILVSLAGMFKTNVSNDEISELVKFQLSEMASWNITSYATTGYDSSNYNYSLPSMKVYVMNPNYESVEKASRLIRQVLDGEAPQMD